MERYPAQIPEDLWNDLTATAVEITAKTNKPLGAHKLIMQILRRSVAARKRIKERKKREAEAKKA